MTPHKMTMPKQALRMAKKQNHQQWPRREREQLQHHARVQVRRRRKREEQELSVGGTREK